MAKLTDLFGRKVENGAEAPPRAVPNPLSASSAAPSATQTPNRPNGGERPSVLDTTSDLGSRMGEENEALRNMLSDAGRKIGELDQLKQAFDKLVNPFNATLRALEEEKSQTLSLSGMLAESRTAYETLRNEFDDIERKATALEAEADRLRENLELASETNRSLESNVSELANEISSNRAQIAELERQFAQESAQRRSLSEARRAAQEQVDASEKHIVELEGELAAAREKLVLMEDDRHSLQTAVDHGLNENARLGRRLTESENALTATRAQLGKVESSFAEAYAERGRLAASLDEVKEQHQAERNTMSMRLDALSSRAATAERLLAEARQNLLARTEEVRAFDRKATEATIARNAVEKRLGQIETAHEARERQVKELEQARNALAERNNGLTKQLKARDTARTRAEVKIAALTERNGQLEADVQVGRTRIEKRVEDLSSALQRERLERAVVEGALEAARKDNARLQSEMTELRASIGRRAPLDAENALAPSAPANEDVDDIFEPGTEARAAPKTKRGTWCPAFPEKLVRARRRRGRRSYGLSLAARASVPGSKISST
ncbi:MAG: hypothetical protein P8Z80_13705, partial [Pseudolabrys sp.]